MIKRGIKSKMGKKEKWGAAEGWDLYDKSAEDHLKAGKPM